MTNATDIHPHIHLPQVNMPNTGETGKNAPATYTTPSAQIDSSPASSTPSTTTTKSECISNKKVFRARRNVSDNELGVLRLIIARKAILTDQLTRITLGKPHVNHLQVMRRKLHKLEEQKLIRAENYTKSCYDYGSTAKLWRPTKLGLNVGALNETDKIYFNETAQNFKLEHILAVNEIEATLYDITREHEDFSIGKVEHEPVCWRKASDRYGSNFWLRPDAFVEILRDINGQTHAVHYFIELDRGTEEPKRLVAKCQVYINYLKSTSPSDWCHGVRPLIVWVVQDEARKNTLISRIHEKFDNLGDQLFDVILPNELPDYMIGLPNAPKPEANHG